MHGNLAAQTHDRRSNTICGVVTTVQRNGRLRFRSNDVDLELHPVWLRERSRELGDIDVANGQRLYEPTDLDRELAVEDCAWTDLGGEQALEVRFNDGHRMTITLAGIVQAAAGRSSSDEPPPRPVPWMAADVSVPVIDHRRLYGVGTDAVDAKHEALSSFFELGFFFLSNTPAVPDALHDITAHFGRISPTNFGVLFDVRTKAVPVDMAYTPVALSAHTDQPYRSPTPGIQFLHTIVNDAPGGASTMVDGLAAVDTLRAVDPEAHALLCSLPVEFRYDIGGAQNIATDPEIRGDVKVMHAPLIERRSDGSFGQIRFSPRLDHAPLVDAEILEVFYRGRRWLAAALNDPARQIEYHMTAGDVLVVDNHRVLHGRTSFDPTRGDRHLQGCYIDHDGPITEWILNDRARSQGTA